jgi:hypothetical protein
MRSDVLGFSVSLFEFCQDSSVSALCCSQFIFLFLDILSIAFPYSLYRRIIYLLSFWLDKLDLPELDRDNLYGRLETVILNLNSNGYYDDETDAMTLLLLV